MASTYLSFRNRPSLAQLAADASISYITTTTTINEPDAILKHLAALAKQIQTKEEKVLSTIETPYALCIETQTTLLFKEGGGVYLPGIDSNFLVERQVTFPLTHVVRLDNEQKIQQVRLYWDQGTLLKQVDVIGRTGRNWPIRDGQAQIDAIVRSANAESTTSTTKASAPLASRSPNEVVINQHRKMESISATRDPHASLMLFAERDPNEDEAALYQSPRRTKRDSAKPPPRQYEELFVGADTNKTGSAVRSSSPVKGGAGKHFVENRLFDEDDSHGMASPESKKTFDQKYDHFTFGDSEEVRPRSNRGVDKNKTTFSFEDFSTPPKVEHKSRPDYERHWGAGVDEVRPPQDHAQEAVLLTERQDMPTPAPKRPVVHQPRPDSVPQWEMTDVPLRSDAVPKFKSGTAVDAARRADEFEPHYVLADKSPAGGSGRGPRGNARSDQEVHWGFSAPAEEKKIYKTAGDGMGGRTLDLFAAETPTKDKKIFKTAGDGMGGRGARSWGIGDDSDPEVQSQKQTTARGRRAQAQTGATDDF